VTVGKGELSWISKLADIHICRKRLQAGKSRRSTRCPGQTEFFIGADLPGVEYSLNFFPWEGDQSITHASTAGHGWND
jgi:hypothetical protein